MHHHFKANPGKTAVGYRLCGQMGHVQADCFNIPDSLNSRLPFRLKEALKPLRAKQKSDTSYEKTTYHIGMSIQIKNHMRNRAVRFSELAILGSVASVTMFKKENRFSKMNYKSGLREIVELALRPSSSMCLGFITAKNFKHQP